MAVCSCTCMHVDKTVDEVEEEEDVNSCDIKEIVMTSECSVSFPEIETPQQQLDLIMKSRKNQLCHKDAHSSTDLHTNPVHDKSSLA